MGNQHKDTVLSLPSFIVPPKTKDENGNDLKNREDCAQWKWGKKIMQGLSAYGNSFDKESIERIYDYAEAEINEDNFKHITELYTSIGNDAVIPSVIRNVGLFQSIENSFCGEIDKQDISFVVSLINGDAITEDMQAWAKRTAKRLAASARKAANMEELFGQPMYEEDEYAEDFISEDDEDMVFSTARQKDIINRQHGLDYLMSESSNTNFRYKITEQLLRDFIRTGRMGARVFNDYEDPNFSRIHPKNLRYLLKSDNPFIHQGVAAWYDWYASPQEIIDMYPDLPEHIVEKLESLQGQYEDGRLSDSDFKKYGCHYETIGSRKILTIKLTVYQWRAEAVKRAMFTKNKFDKNNDLVKFVGNESNVKKKGVKYKDLYDEEIWEGTEIGGTFFHKIQPIEQQIKNKAGRTRKDFTIVGIADPNPSLAKMIMPLDELRIQFFHEFELLMGQTKGKILFIDEAIESNNAENLYLSKVYNIWRYNTAKEGEFQLGQRPKPHIEDWGLSTAITEVIGAIQFIDANISNITGLNNQWRTGQFNAGTGLGVLNNSLAQAQTSIQMYATKWSLIVQVVLQKLLDFMPYCWADKETVKYFLGRDGMKMLQTTSEDFKNGRIYGVYVSNAASDKMKTREYLQIASQVLPSSGDIDAALSIIEMSNASNSTEALEKFKKSVATMRKRQEQREAAAQQAQVQAAQMVEQARQTPSADQQLQSQTDIQKEQIRGEYKLRDTEIKAENRGDVQDAKKQDKIDERMLEHELSKQEV